MQRAAAIARRTQAHAVQWWDLQKAALAQAVRLLAPGGSIGIADFFNHALPSSYLVCGGGWGGVLRARLGRAGWGIRVSQVWFCLALNLVLFFLQHKPVQKMFASVYDFGCKMWFRQDGVHLLQDSVRFGFVVWLASPGLLFLGNCST